MKGYDGAMIERFYDIKCAVLTICEKNHMHGLSEMYDVLVSYSFNFSSSITKKPISLNEDL